jgi:hypothetical protein
MLVGKRVVVARGPDRNHDLFRRDVLVDGHIVRHG